MSFFDITPDNHDEVVNRLVMMVEQAPPSVLEDGLAWYGNAHEQARQLADTFGVTLRQGAGMFAAASPGIEAAIIPGEIGNAICGRTTQLMGRQRDKVLHCVRYDPTEILNPRTGPKTWAFFWNVYSPTLRDHVTVDGRHADIIANTMRPWKVKRGIDFGGPGTRYERYEFVTEDAAKELRKCGRFRSINAPQVQAVVWCEGRRIERLGLTAKGLPRQQSLPRRGQPYTKEHE